MIVCHGRFLPSEFFGNSDGRVGSGSGVGIAGLDIEKRPDGARPFGRGEQYYESSGNDYFCNLEWSTPMQGSGFF